MASDENERDDEDETSAQDGDPGAEGEASGEGDSSSDGESSAEKENAAGSGEGEGEGEGEAPGTTPASAAAAAAKKAARTSAGARLAAAKAAKAAKKAVKKAQYAAEAQAVTSPRASAPTEAEAPLEQLKASAVGQAASRAGDWASANQSVALGLAAALVLGMAGYAGWSWYVGSQAQAAGALLAEAVEIANAQIEAEADEEGADDEGAADATDDEGEDDAPSYESVAARAEAALVAYRRVLTEYPSSGAAAWARLGEARALAQTGDAEGARAAYATAIRDHGDDALVALRAYEGAGFTYEAEEDWEHAREEYESIDGLEEGAYHVVGAYHLARLRIATGDRVGAQTALEELIEEIETATEGPESPFPYVLAQAQARLRELDPSSASGSDAPTTIGGPGGGIPEGISPEVLEALRRAMGESGGAGAPE